MLKNRISVLALAVALTLCSCSGTGGSNDDGVGLAVVDNGGQSFAPNVHPYSYPEFLSKIDTTETLSNVSYRSFDPSFVSEVTTQPFEGKECIASCSGHYIYKSGNFVGVLDSSGNTILEADTFARAEFVSGTILRMYLYDFEGSDYIYADISDKQNVRLIDNYAFKSSNIRISERRVEDSDRVLMYLISNGTAVTQTGYDSISQKDISELPASVGCKKAYTVTKDGAYYIITFDEFYNYTIFEDTYAKIDLSIA